MYSLEQNIIRESLDKWSKDFLSNNFVYLFGVNDYAREIIKYLFTKGIKINAIFDNDQKKQGSYCQGVPVVAPTEKTDGGEYIICSVFWHEMQAQLLDEGVSEEHIFCIILPKFGETLKESLRDLFRGRRIYQKIRQLYPNEKILLCPYTGTGDIYLICTFLEAYLTKEKIMDYVLVVVSSPCEKVTRIFSIPQIYCIDGPEACRALTKYYMVCPQVCNLKILNDSWGDVYTNPEQWVRGLHDLDFATVFRRFVFDLPECTSPIHPIFLDASAEIKELAYKHALKRKKTVILAPYSTTLSDLSVSFWEELAAELKVKGWRIVTNSGSKDEPPIKGTEGVFFPLNIAPQFITWAGAFIGVRSGLCDVISGADAKKIILYDSKNYFFNCPAYDYFSLKQIGLCEDAIELCFDNRNLYTLKTQVLEAME